MNRLVYTTLLLILCTHRSHAFEKTTYTFSHDPIDVVIPCHPKDAHALNHLLPGIRNNVIGLRRIIIVSPAPFNDEVEWFDEALFPFSKQDLLKEVCKTPEAMEKAHNKKTISWIYQQFLKLYAPLCIPDISANVLIVDADVFFLKPINFLQENGAGLYAPGGEYHPPYFEHAQRVLPDLKKLYRGISGIAHHMLFQREVLLDFFDHVRKYHNAEPWQAIARVIALDGNQNIVFSGMSEYEMYFNFAFARTDQVQMRLLKWRNIRRGREIQRCIQQNFDYVALHVYQK